MNAEEIQNIKERMNSEYRIANGILDAGDENYDGSDGARTVRDLCKIIDRLLAALDVA